MRTFLLNSTLCIPWHRRNYLPLQGSAIATTRGAVIFAGICGSGKSTLAAAFARRGYTVLADNISVITFGPQGAPQLLSAGGSLKLWRDAAHKLGCEGEVGRAIQLELKKSYGSRPGPPDSEPVALYGIYILQAAHVAQVRLQRLEDAAKLAPLQNNLYPPLLPLDLYKRNVLCQQLTQLANQVEVHLLTRPRQLFVIDQLVALLETDWQ